MLNQFLLLLVMVKDLFVINVMFSVSINICFSDDGSESQASTALMDTTAGVDIGISLYIL